MCLLGGSRLCCRFDRHRRCKHAVGWLPNCGRRAHTACMSACPPSLQPQPRPDSLLPLTLPHALAHPHTRSPCTTTTTNNPSPPAPARYAFFTFDCVYVKFMCETVKMTNWGRVYYTNALSLVPFMIVLPALNEHNKVGRARMVRLWVCVCVWGGGGWSWVRLHACMHACILVGIFGGRGMGVVHPLRTHHTRAPLTLLCPLAPLRPTQPPCAHALPPPPDAPRRACTPPPPPLPL